MTEPGHGSSSLPTTSWTLVLEARSRDTPVGRAAFATLCERYWPPVYAYVRRRGHSADAAAEITQELFEQLMARDGLARLERGDGRFRGFLKVAVERLLVARLRKATLAKRGGRQQTLSLDGLQAERGYDRVDPSASPEHAFELAWALVVRDRAMARLADYYDTDARRPRWEALSRFALAEADPTDYATAAERLGATDLAVRKAVDRMRKKLTDFAREETAYTVAQAELLEAELSWSRERW